MHFVNQVDLETAARWRILHVIEQIAHIINTGSRCRIHFDQVDKSAFINFITAGTFATGNRANTLLAVKALRENTRNGGFTHTAGSGKQIGMVQSVIIQRINQRLEHMFLTCHLGKGSRTPFSGKYLITHRIICFSLKRLYYREISGALEALMAMTPNSHTSAHSVIITVAPFRAWRSS